MIFIMVLLLMEHLFIGIQKDVNGKLKAQKLKEFCCKLIWVENPDISCLVDYSRGGVLQLLNYKVSAVNYANVWHDDGGPTIFLGECLLPNADLSADQIGVMLAGRDSLLMEPYDYQVKRGSQSAQVQLSGEQGYRVGEKQGVFLVKKELHFDNGSPRIGVAYEVANTTYQENPCYDSRRSLSILCSRRPSFVSSISIVPSSTLCSMQMRRISSIIFLRSAIFR